VYKLVDFLVVDFIFKIGRIWIAGQAETHLFSQMEREKQLEFVQCSEFHNFRRKTLDFF
jgi:hypothetical protein